MAKTNNLHDFLVDLANAIRTKKKYPDSQMINPQDFSDEIDGISGGDNKLAQLMSKTITEVTEEDFGNATSIGESVFKGCTSLTNLTIPDSVTSVGSYAFQGCSSLTSVTIPASVTSIGTSAFYNCSKISKIYITDLAAWCQPGFIYLMQYGASSKELYLNGTLLTDLVIPDRVTSIGGYAFQGCSSLISVTIPDSVTSIGQSAFYGCSSLTSVTIPGGVASIGQSAFYNCSKISKIYITDLAAWCKISGLTYLMGYGASSKELYLNGTLPTDLVIPDRVTSIGSNTFRACTSITNLTIPSSVTSIGDFAFYSCSSLTSATFEGTPTSISSSAFLNDTALRDIYVPWNKGAVSGAPWGASSATIHYNWTPPTPGGDYTGAYTAYGSYSMRYFKIYDANDSLISSGDVDWEGTVTVPQGGHIVVSAQETYGGIYVKVNNLVNCTASAVDSWAETVTITPTADNFSFHCADDFD